ncbi:MAG TPA: MFS transporter [Actinomycetota bacterium]|nr:MFS transporter [Actinomycetota bacterium]
MRSSYLAILRLPHVRPLLLASLVGRLPTATGPLSVVLFVQEVTGSLARAGAASAAIALASGLLAPVRGRLVDRLGQRRCLPPMALVFAAALAGMVAVAGSSPAEVAAMVALAAAAGAAAPPLGASMRVLWLSLVGQGPRLQTAYALDAVLDELLFVIGPLLAGALATLYQPSAGVLATAGLAVAGTLGFVASPVSKAQAGSRAAAATGRGGWAGALRGPGMRTLTLSLAGVGAAIGIWEIGLVGAAREAGSPEAASLLLAAWAAASGLGGLWYGARTWRRSPGHRYLALLALLVLAGAPMAAAATPLALGAVVALVGLVLAPLESSAYVLAAELAPPGTLTESGTWLTTAINVTGAAGLTVAGVLVDQAGVPATLAAACACTAAGLLVALAGRDRLGAAPYRGRHEVGHAATRQLRRERRML